MELLAFMWLRDQDNALVYAIRLGDGCARWRYGPLLRAKATRLPIILIFVLVTE